MLVNDRSLIPRAIEEGVRVFRTLPSHNRVIINPEAKASLSLGFEDNRTTSHNYNYNGTSPGSSSSTSGSAPVSGTSPGIAYPLPPVDFKGVPARGGRH
ncbi:MAG TPA: hypothetical protein PK264_24760, partial [Hyphomicrobiaceae bacterium]|nr:hypothetical protein [Hyphomicrobiaceae bacterium]